MSSGGGPHMLGVGIYLARGVAVVVAPVAPDGADVSGMQASAGVLAWPTALSAEASLLSELAQRVLRGQGRRRGADSGFPSPGSTLHPKEPRLKGFRSKRTVSPSERCFSRMQLVSGAIRCNRLYVSC